MNPMYAAIKKRQAGGQAKMGDHQDMAHPSEHTEDADNTSHLHDFVSNLSHGEKQSLKSILENDKTTAQDIAKGGPSTEEKQAIEGSMAEENAETGKEEQQEQERGLDGPQASNPATDSDAIGKSLLDSRYTGGGEMPKPRNLGERMKSHVAQKLKEKGKL